MSIEKLEAEVAKAQTTVDEWEAKAAAARAEVDEAERGSGAAILADPDAAEGITLKVQTLERKARAYDTAAEEARHRMRPIYRRHVEAEAKELDKSAASLRRDADKHNGEVGKLLDKLEALDGVRYQPMLGAPAHVDDGGVYRHADDAPREAVGQDLKGLADGAELQAKKVRFILYHGRAPQYADDPSTIGESEIGLMARIDTPPLTQAALNAGVL